VRVLGETKVGQGCLDRRADGGGLGEIYCVPMDAERTIAEIEWLERIFQAPDPRPMSQNDLLAANRRHDEKQANSPWFRLWKSYGICCRPEPPGLSLPDSK